jgi:hypothetical protein
MPDSRPIAIRCDHRIVIADDAPLAATTAARELQNHLYQIAGLELTIVNSSAASGEKEILVGASERLTALASGLDITALREEEYVIRTHGAHLLIVGGGQRGTLYGVYGFLRDHLGCRWFTPDCSLIPKRDAIELGPIDERKMPAFEYRNFILDGIDDPTWCARNGFNGFNSPDDPTTGGRMYHWHYGHSLFALCKAEDYLEEHPEYFDSTSREKDVLDDYINLCFTNDDVVQIVADNMRKEMREARDAQTADPDVSQPTVFYLAQHDGGSTCTCPDCQAIIDEQGALSAPLIHFCNRVIAAVGDAFPDYRMMTIAYRFSRRPPKTLKPDPRLIVQLCSIECCQSHPYSTCDDPDDVKFREDMEGWQQLTKQIWVWDYMSRLWHPFLVGPGFDSMAANYRWFHEHNVRGMFTQTAGERDFKWMNAYLMSAMMRDPYQDWQILRDEFMDAFYGTAAVSLREFMKEVQTSVVEGNHHLHYKEGTVKPFFTADVIAAGDRLFAEALAAVAEDPALQVRVREEHIHFLCTKLQHACKDAVLHSCRIENARYVFAHSEDFDRDVATFNNWRSERMGEAAQACTGSRNGSCQMHLESDLIDLGNESLALDFLPRLAGRMVGLRDIASGHNFLHMGPCDEGSFNLENGYREQWLEAPDAWDQESTSGWSTSTGASADAAEAGSDISVGDDAIHFTRVFETGGKYVHPLQWERWTRLAETGGRFQIESMVVNRGIDMVNSAVRTFLPLYLGDLTNVTLNGRALTEGITALTVEDAATGIALCNMTLGIELRWQATGEVIARAQLNVDGTTGCILVSIDTQPIMLTPGAGRRFLQDVEAGRTDAASRR